MFTVCTVERGMPAMRSHLSSIFAALLVQIVRARNPLFSHRFAADPSAHVWPGEDRVYVYASHDQPDAENHDTMDRYHVYSSDDLVNWVDHGLALHLDNVSWAERNMWAPDAVFWKGKYYLVFCALEKSTGMFRTGMAISDSPAGPFTDIGYIKNVEWGQDPALLVDDDGTPYLYWGIGGTCNVAQLTDDLLDIVPGTLKTISDQLPGFYEGPWVHKRHGVYYMSYPAVYDMFVGEHLEYATAPTPYGPWEWRGLLMNTTTCWTNHGSIVFFRRQWYLFYHMDTVSMHNDHRRNLAIEYVNHNADGSIQFMEPTLEGVAESTPFTLEEREQHEQEVAAIRTREATKIRARREAEATQREKERIEREKARLEKEKRDEERQKIDKAEEEKERARQRARQAQREADDAKEAAMAKAKREGPLVGPEQPEGPFYKPPIQAVLRKDTSSLGRRAQGTLWGAPSGARVFPVKSTERILKCDMCERTLLTLSYLVRPFFSATPGLPQATGHKQQHFAHAIELQEGGLR